MNVISALLDRVGLAARRGRTVRKSLFRALVAIALLLSALAAAPAQVALSPYPKLFFFTTSGAPASGYELFTYAAGTTTKQNTYTSSTGLTPNTNPIILDTLGSANVWLTTTLSYKFVLAPPNSSDPPTAPIFTVDNITAGGGSGGGGGGTGQCVTGSTLISSSVGTYCVNATATTTLTLPANPNLWESHTISDIAGNAGTFNITIAGNGNTISGLTNYVLAFNYQSVTVQWTGTQWAAQ